MTDEARPSGSPLGADLTRRVGGTLPGATMTLEVVCSGGREPLTLRLAQRYDDTRPPGR